VSGTSDVLRRLLLALVAVLTLPEDQRLLLLMGLMRELLRGVAHMGMLSTFQGLRFSQSCASGGRSVVVGMR
jgi:hypothetical protein